MFHLGAICPKGISANWNLSRSFYQPSDKREYSVTDDNPRRVQYQIVNVRYAVWQQKLNHFDTKRNTGSRQKHIPKAVQAFVQDRENDSCRDKEWHIPDDVDERLAFYLIIGDVKKGNKIDPRRKDFLCLNDQWLNLTVDGEKRTKTKRMITAKLIYINRSKASCFQQNLFWTTPVIPR